MAHDFFIRCVAFAHRPAVGLALVMLILSAGCGRSPSGVTVNNKGDGVDVTFKGTDGEKGRVPTAENGAPLPYMLRFPKDVAVYPNATFQGGMGSGSAIYGWKTADPAEKVMAFYRNKVKEDGWTIKTLANTDRKRKLEAEKGERRKLTVVVSSESGRTMIILTISPSPFNEPGQ